MCVVDESGGLAEREPNQLGHSGRAGANSPSRSASSDRICRFCGQRFINQGWHMENACPGPDPKPARRIVDGTAEPLDRGPVDGNYCPVCGEFTLEWHRHHVVGRGQGGDDVPANLVWLCPGCHDRLHNMGGLVEFAFVLYVRSLEETLEYIADTKYRGWLEDRYLGVRL